MILHCSCDLFLVSLLFHPALTPAALTQESLGGGGVGGLRGSYFIRALEMQELSLFWQVFAHLLALTGGETLQPVQKC